uniref:L-fucokinase domain-containing protein n=1 Tax=Panagrolaimus sp. PS1159 TaxID=55785 RepID=A0AC35G564_9BILA
MVRWDYLIIAAGNNYQGKLFEFQLEQLKDYILQYANKYYVQVDKYPGIGAGMATAHIISRLLEEQKETAENLKVLVIHSGGFSKRLPHAAPFGKIFTNLPDGSCILEHKLKTYRNIPELCCPGVFISACDTIETLDNIEPTAFKKSFFDTMVIFGHFSSLEIATQHGVFIIDKEIEGRQTLKRVLQKPTIEEMEKNNAIWNDAMAITDSCYMFGIKFAREFAEFCEATEKKLGGTEICCYGDFMRPIGTEATKDYIEEANSMILRQWRQKLYDFFNAITGKEALIIGVESMFHHFGLPNDLLDNIAPNGPFYNESNPRFIYSNIGPNVTIDNSSFGEFCTINANVKIPEKCLLSGIEINQDSEDIIFIPNTSVITWLQKDGKYVTLIFDNSVDIKTEGNNLKWFSTLLIDKQNLFTAKLFPICDTPAESLKQTFISNSMCRCYKNVGTKK